ncbi:hypothetical protein WA026_010002 [Henosepilachna vigintioctopunctata]|uniref:Ectopic P granules protein 5 homolog n=1 Tax=Henosepilachna vigintioctopunctata TaxID=420089 RepID=A0AAW1TRS1_9CUCU
MALSRSEQVFILAATIDLLHIGFVNKSTQEICSKTSKILLTHITSKHPRLLSDILKEIRENIAEIGDLCLYLYEELPLSIWKLNANDFDILSRLLLTSSPTQIESKLARMILSRLNWGFNEDETLFLPYELHCDVAILVLQAVDQEPAFQNWGWQTILRLKLHISDHGFKEIGRVMDIERYDILVKGVRDKQPLHSFVSLLMTSWGHLVPLICSKGLGQLIFLQSQQKHEAVLFALYLIMPLFIDCQECIINCIEFQEVLLNLLNADRGYISMAKAFIVSTNTVLEQFGNMIETQMVNYKSYNLESPKFLVRLWMNSLISTENWTRDYGVLYLLNVIIRAAFFHVDALMAAESELRELIQASTPQEQSGGISSFFKWVSYSNQNTSLISSSLSPFPWLAYLMISIEHDEREKKSRLWMELLVQLNIQKGKVNVDAAIKKATNAIRVPSFSSSALCIYRYAQQALDTPVDHPLIVLIWQKFFELYLERAPTSGLNGKGCVGSKFFEGMINFAFLKKMKRRLQEIVQYYQEKIDELEKSNDINPDMLLYQSGVRICTAFALWLEEPRLQESNLLVQSLPPQYESQLLLLVIQGISKPWYEYLNYNKVKQEQQECVRIWRVSNFRENTNVNRPLPNPGNGLESNDAVERIFRRLTSYDVPKCAPSIEKGTTVVPVVDISSYEGMFNMLKPKYHILKQFAHNHLLRVSEHKALNCSYQELVPQLYRSVLVKVNKKVPCKGKNQSVNCSGAATIELQTEEARINERINHQIESNRKTYDSLLSTSLNAPSSSLCAAAVFIQHTIRILQQQLNCNPAAADLGVELFYYLLPMLNEEITNYLPTKTLFSTCLEKLGQSHICGVEFEMPRLLDRIIKEPDLGQYLAPHFSPGNVGSSSLLLMYKSISEAIGQEYDVSFALLSKFDIDNWLHNKKPKLNQRSQFIEFVIKGLSELGNEPPIQAMILHGLYRKHLVSVFEFQFPEHYGEVLVNLLKYSSGTSEVPPLAISVWLDILNSLSSPLHIHMKVPLREQLRAYAQSQRKLCHQEILETTQLLARHFTQERLQYGLYGLYPKCRHYLDIYRLLLGMAGHVLITSSLNTHQGLVSDKMCEKIWPYIRDMFAPWIAPYSMQNVKENMATWIQQLTDDRSVLLPWITADVHLAQSILNVFQECILFLLHVLPACSIILNYIWQWYVTTFAHISVKEHILNLVHETLMVLPWQNFCPSINDLEIMLRVVDQYLPECHQFLGHIFISTQWINWMKQFSNCPMPVKSRVDQCFINLIVKLSNEPNIRSAHVKKLNNLLVHAENLNWDMLEPSVYQHVMDWYIMSCDCNVIFKSDPIDLDFRVLNFLKTVSGYNEVVTAYEGRESLNKRYIYVRSYVKLMSVFASRHKLTVPSREKEIYAVINNQVKHLEIVVKSDEELNLIIQEFLNILNIPGIGHLGLKCICQWISTKSGNDIVIALLLQISSQVVSNYEYVASLYELAIESYFQNVNEQYEPSWRHIAESSKIVSMKQIELEQVLVNKGSILTLHAILLRKVSLCSDYNMLMNQCLDWLSSIKISDTIESKLPLLWIVLLDLSLKHSETNESATGAVLYRFSQILLQISNEKGSSGWGRGFLNVIGITKTASISLPFKFLCRAMGGYILAQLPEMKGQPQVIRKTANANSRVGQPGGNTECVKILLKLDFGQTQGKLKECAELALNQIQDSNNSLHNAKHFLLLLTKHFYNKPYYRDIS